MEFENASAGNPVHMAGYYRYSLYIGRQDWMLARVIPVFHRGAGNPLLAGAFASG